MRALWARIAPATFLRFGRPDDRELGQAGEELAARLLLRAGYRIVGRRLRTPGAEIDIVALDGATLVCVEVKSARRVGPRWRPGGRLGPRRLARQRAAARQLAQRTWLGARPRTARVDLVEVSAPAGGAARLIHHRSLTRVLARNV